MATVKPACMHACCIGLGLRLGSISFVLTSAMYVQPVKRGCWRRNGPPSTRPRPQAQILPQKNPFVVNVFGVLDGAVFFAYHTRGYQTASVRVGSRVVPGCVRFESGGGLSWHIGGCTLWRLFLLRERLR